MRSDSFKRYDFGSDTNLRKYNQTTPPDYPLQDIKNIPIAIIAGMQDELADAKDIDWLNE